LNFLQRLDTIESLLKQVVEDKTRAENCVQWQMTNIDGQITEAANKIDADNGKLTKIGGQITEIADDALKCKKAAERKERIRLKERLRESLSLTKAVQKIPWSNHIFGISPLDQRSGKEGSRLFFLLGRCSIDY
jgi:hypothetical protein